MHFISDGQRLMYILVAISSIIQKLNCLKMKIRAPELIRQIKECNIYNYLIISRVHDDFRKIGISNL